MAARLRTSRARRRSPAVVIIVNNLDYPQRYAAWFSGKQAKRAIALAKGSGFHVINVDSEALEELASRLREGALKGGNLSLAIVDGDITHELDSIVAARQAVIDAIGAEATTQTAIAGTSAAGEADSQLTTGERAQSSDAALTDYWSDLQEGALVLAADLDRQGAAEAWYEAIVIRLEGAEFVLRWRDFPREGLLTRTRRHIAILDPAS